jgi:hypothetical protein
MPARISSLEPPGDAVKQAKLERKSRPGGRPPFIGQTFEGWELAALTVGLVLAAALLAVPRPAVPGPFPVPLVDVAEARETRARNAALADRAEREGLPFETRAVGDGVRRLGVALAEKRADPDHFVRLLAERVELALAAGQAEKLEQLRAVQARLFVRAVRAYSWQDAPPAELAALGGDFVERARANGWAADDGFIGSDDELTSLFMRRWSDLTRLREHARFKPALGELRRYFRFLLLHPERRGGFDSQALVMTRLRYVEALARYDGDYPASLARGALYGSLGMPAESAAALSGHLARHPSGEWRLRARNYLLAAARGREGSPSELSGDAP